MANQATEAVTINVSYSKIRSKRQKQEKRGVPHIFNV